MIYILYCKFDNTKDNHTGMAYFFKKLANEYPDIRLIENINQNFSGSKLIGFICSILLAFYLKLILKKNDKVVFGEYLTKDVAFQDVTARLLRMMGCKNHFSGLVHLAPSHLLELYGGEEHIKCRLNNIDEVFSFGSSLTSFIRRISSTIKLNQVLHYVENNYYQYDENLTDRYDPIQVLVMGSIKRDFKTLLNVLKKAPQSVYFHLCLGRSYNELKPSFKDFKNTKVYSYLKEDELKSLMERSLVNMSILIDTVGSNAITTSLAMGQIQIVSEVGSIKDYCRDSFSIFCNSEVDFIEGIRTVANFSSEKLLEMSREAYNVSEEMWLDNAIVKFKQMLDA